MSSAFGWACRYSAPFGHRGATHSLIAAALLALLVGIACGRVCVGLLALAVAVSHPLLDALTDGGLGVALLWPASDARFFAPWRPIPVAPIGARLLSARGLHVMGLELAVFSPLLVWSLWRAFTRSSTAEE